MKVTAALPTGVAALFFESAKKRRRLESSMVEQLEHRGFSEVLLPVIDYLEPYEQIESEESRSELYRFVGRDGEVLSLRSDFTPMLARLLAPRLAALDLPLRFYYRGDVLRYRQEHAGSQRELAQIGAEVLGLPGEEAEREALTCFLDTVASGERRRVLVVLGFAGALDRLILGAAGRIAPAELTAALVRRERRLARLGGQALLQVVENGVPDDPSALGEDAAARLAKLHDLCKELADTHPQLELRIDLAEFADQTADERLHEAAGGRAYYDGLVFRAFAGASAEPIGGGGRYDSLFERLGARVTAAGFSVSIDRLMGRTSQDDTSQGDTSQGDASQGDTSTETAS